MDQHNQAPNTKNQPESDNANQWNNMDIRAQAPVSLEGFFAIRANYDEDKKATAKDYAERAVIAEAASTKNIFKKLWKGTLVKKYYERKYTREILSGERKIEADEESITLDELFAKNQAAALERFRRGISEDLAFEKADKKELTKYIHDGVGEDYRVDQKSTAIVQKAIKDFVNEHQEAFKTGNANPKELKNSFSEYLGRYQAEAKDSGVKLDYSVAEEYSNAALEALELSQHAAGIDNVIEGFRIYEARVKDGARTEIHKNALEKGFDWLESHTGLTVPLDVIAGASGAAIAIVQGTARGALGAFGLFVPVLASGIREYGHLTDDRNRMLRDQELGITYDYARKTEQEINDLGLKGAEKKRALHESKIGRTLYETTSATKLISEIKDAQNQADKKALLVALATARFSIDFSDINKKGLIAYSPGKAGDERLALDIATIEAEKSLSDEDRETYQTLLDKAKTKAEKEIKQKDQNFAKFRAIEAIKKSGKTFAFGAAGFFLSQEALAIANPAKIGVFEKLGLKLDNNYDAKETVLAKGINTNGTFDITRQRFSSFRVEDSDPATMAKLEKQGYVKTKIAEGATVQRTVTTSESVDPAHSIFNRSVKYDGWASNGTKMADGNETRLFLNNGQFTSGMLGNSTTGAKALNYEDLVNAGSIKGYVTIGGAKMEVVHGFNQAGQLTWGNNGILEVVGPDGTTSTIRAIGENGEKLYKYFEVVVDNGEIDGVQHIIPLATDVGRNTFSGTIDQITTTLEDVTEPAVYEFTKTIDVTRTIARGLDTQGIFSVAAISDMLQGHTNLGIPTTAREVPSASETIAEPPEPTPNLNTQEVAETALRGSIEAMRGLIGNEGVEILTSSSPLNNAFYNRFETWWNSLDATQRAAVKDIETQVNETPGLKKSLNWGSAALVALAQKA